MADYRPRPQREKDVRLPPPMRDILFSCIGELALDRRQLQSVPYRPILKLTDHLVSSPCAVLTWKSNDNVDPFYSVKGLGESHTLAVGRGVHSTFH